MSELERQLNMAFFQRPPSFAERITDGLKFGASLPFWLAVAFGSLVLAVIGIKALWRLLTWALNAF